MGRRLAVAVKVTATSYHAVHVKQPKLSAQLSAMGEEEKINIATYSKICSVQVYTTVPRTKSWHELK